MSTKARKRAASRGRQASPADQFRGILGSVRDAVQTKSGRSFIGVIKFLVSLLTLFYFKGVIRMAYYSMFYRLEIPEDHRGAYCFLVTVVCIFFGAVMLFTRRQIVTRFVIMVSMIFYLPIILFNYRHLVLLVPLMIMVVITYLASGTSEGPKTIFGAVFIMIYILGAFVFITVQSILQPATEEKVIKRGVTEKGNYRYSIVQVLDQGDGNTYVSDLGQKKDSFKVGQEIDILYNPNNPEGIVLPGKTIWIIFMLAGAAVAVIASVLLVRDLRNR